MKGRRGQVFWGVLGNRAKPQAAGKNLRISPKGTYLVEGDRFFWGVGGWGLGEDSRWRAAVAQLVITVRLSCDDNGSLYSIWCNFV